MIQISGIRLRAEVEIIDVTTVVRQRRMRLLLRIRTEDDLALVTNSFMDFPRPGGFLVADPWDVWASVNRSNFDPDAAEERVALTIMGELPRRRQFLPTLVEVEEWKRESPNRLMYIEGVVTKEEGSDEGGKASTADYRV